MRTLRPVRPPVAIEREYHKRLKNMILEMDRSLYWWLRAEYRKMEPVVVGDALFGDLRRKMSSLATTWKRKFNEKADALAKWFAEKIRSFTTRNLQNQMNQSNLAPLGFDLEFKYHSQQERVIFQSIVEQNVNLIKSISSEHLTQVQGIVLRGIESGHDLGRVTEELTKSFGITERRAAMIARDQTAKATNNLTRQRLLDYGVTKGKWMHTSSGKTYRDSHVEMDGEIYDLIEGCYDPDYGSHIQPAELVNCHCLCVPVIDMGRDKVEDRVMDFNENHDPDNGQFAPSGGGSGSSGKGNGTDVKQEYLDKATPGKGKILCDAGYHLNSHKKEVETANVLHTTFGGDIHLLNESQKIGEKRPDCEWNGKLWDYKTLSTEKSADSAVRYGLKQIATNPGGLVLVCSNNDMSVEKIEQIVDRRMHRSNKGYADIMIIKNEKVESVKRYKK